MAKKKKNVLKTVASIAIGVFAAPVAAAIGVSGAIGGFVGSKVLGSVIGSALVGGAAGAATGTGALQGAIAGGIGGFASGGGGPIPVTSTSGAAIKGGVQYAPITNPALVSNPSQVVNKAGLALNPGVAATLATSPTSAPVVASNAVAKTVPNAVAPVAATSKQIVAPTATSTAKAADIAAQTTGPQNIAPPPTPESTPVAAGTTAVNKAGLPINPGTAIDPNAVKTLGSTPVAANPTVTVDKSGVVMPAANTPSVMTPDAVKVLGTPVGSQVPNPVKAPPKEVFVQAPQASVQTQAQKPVIQQVAQAGLKTPTTQAPATNTSSGVTGALQRIGGAVATNFMSPEGLMALTQMAMGMSPTPEGLEEAVAARQQELEAAQAQDQESYDRIRETAYSMLAEIGKWDPRRMALDQYATEVTRSNRAAREQSRRAKAKGYFGGEVAANERKNVLDTARAGGEAYNEGLLQGREKIIDAKGKVITALGVRAPVVDQGAYRDRVGDIVDIETNRRAGLANAVGGLINVGTRTVRDVWPEEKSQDKWAQG